MSIGSRRSIAERRIRVGALLLVALVASLLCVTSACASTTSVYGFGDNHEGELGNTTSNDPQTTPTVVAMPGATGPVVEIALGGLHSLAITSTGQLFAFGDDTWGELGTSVGPDPNPTPTLVTLPGATGPVSVVAAGYTFSLAATSTGQLYAFGENRYGQLGSTTNNGGGTANPTPTLVTLPGQSGPVTLLAAGDEFSLAATSTGQLYAFGENYWGQLGSRTRDRTEDANPTPKLVTLPGATGSVAQLAAGAVHSLVLTSTGQLYAFGGNEGGQLGSTTNSGSGEANPTPTLVTLPGETGPVTQVAAGYAHSLALTSTGQLYAFGENYFGQLGSTTNNHSGFDGSGTPNPTPTLVTLPGASGQATQLAAGQYHSLALTSSGQLYAFGLNDVGQLGSLANIGTEEANPTPTLVGLPGRAESLGTLSTANDSMVLVEAAGPAPTVTKISPKKGPAAGSTTVTVTGTGFAGATSVRFGSANALSYEVDSTTSITAVAPPHTSGAVEVTVTTPNGQSAPTSRARYTYEAPTVTSVSPDVGSREGDAAVTVTGSGFAPGTGTTVFEFGKGVALSVSCASTGECTMRAPAARKVGAVDVRAKAAGKTSKKNPPADQYTYD
jgi:alpha-tubulin suppressor-like RCC1 family protein